MKVLCGAAIIITFLFIAKSEPVRKNPIAFKLTKLFEDVLHYDTLNQEYAKMTEDLNTEVLNGVQLLEEMSESFRSSIDIVQSLLKDTAEYTSQLYESHINYSCCSNITDMCNSLNVSSSYYRSEPYAETPPLHFEYTIDRSVNLDYSQIRIPVNVYENSDEVVCFIEWSRNLTDRFIENWNKVTSTEIAIIAFQYFGDTTSNSLIIYPSEEYIFPCCDDCPFERFDTYNVKSRPWYIETGIGNKDIVILMDFSGSMRGLSIELAKLSAKQLISSLTKGDYFMVVRVGSREEPSFCEPLGDCFNDLVQATDENVEVMKNLIDRAEPPQGVADFTNAMKFASKKLNETSTSCHKIIAIFSDGDAYFPVEEYTDSSNIVVFAFKVGSKYQHTINDLKLLACNNKGSFKDIDNYDKVVLSTHTITEEFNRFSSETEVFLQHYTDYFTGRLVITMSTPVKATVDGQSEFIGALGFDVLSVRSELDTKGSKLGSLGYVFIIDKHGELLYHPMMTGQELSFTDHFLTFDMTQLEFEAYPAAGNENIKTIRQQMIGKETGQMSIMSYVSMTNTLSQVRFIIKNMTYYYTPDFRALSIALKLPSEGVEILSDDLLLSQSQLEDLQQYLRRLHFNHSHQILINQNNKLYCYNQAIYNLHTTNDSISFLIYLIDVALNNSITSSCSSYVYHPLLNDLYFMYQHRSLINSTSTDVLTAFIQFSSGLLWCVKGSDCVQLFDTNYIGLAENNGNDTLSVYRGANKEDSNSAVVVVRPLTLPSKPMVSIGVVGMIISTSYFDNMVEALSVNNTVVYLMDEGGHILYDAAGSTGPSNNDSFMGNLCPELFNELIRQGVFVNHTVVGYAKKRCDNQAEGYRSWGNRFTGILSTLLMFVHHLFIAVTYTIIQSLLFIIPGSFSYNASVNCSTTDIIDICLYEVTFYIANYSLIQNELNGTFTDEDDSVISYQANVLPNTSIIKVSTNSTVYCNITESLDIRMRKLDCPCSPSQSPLYTSGQSSSARCMNQFNYTSARDCSGVTTTTTTPSSYIVLLTIFLTYFIIEFHSE